MQPAKRIILIDADVVSHFITGGEAESIHTIFPACAIHMLDTVQAELQKWPRAAHLLAQVSIMLSKKRVRLMEFPDDNEDIRLEYFRMVAAFKGRGESACLAVARFNQHIVASSNLKDIQHYCTTHQIEYLTTMDFLCEALQSGLWDEARCDAFIAAVLAAKSKLPVGGMSEWKGCRDVGFARGEET